MRAREFIKSTQEDYSPDNPPGPESRPTMPRGTVRVDVSDVYDWYKLGQHISNMKGLGRHDFGKGPPSTIISFGDEETEHKYIKDLEKTGLSTTDIDPRAHDTKKGQKTDPTFNVDEARIIDADSLIDVYLRGRKGKELVTQLVARNLPNRHLEALVKKLIDKHNVNPNTIVYGPSKKIDENFAHGRKFVKPNFDVEWEEAERYPEFVKLGKDAWIKLAQKGRAVAINSAQGINNTDAGDPDSFKSLHPAKQKRALAQLETGTVEMPIVAVYGDGRKELVGGNTRLTAMMARDGQATVWAFRVPSEQGVAENFADGKNPGRKGLAKRVGVDCKQPVSKLRSIAKKSSGERQRMAHWCANMKAGKK